jgi:hypothetical protein
MKKLILLSLLVIFSCSKDSEEEAGNEIIGQFYFIYTSNAVTEDILQVNGGFVKLVEFKYQYGPNGELSGYFTNSIKSRRLTKSGNIIFNKDNTGIIKESYLETQHPDGEDVIVGEGFREINFNWEYLNNKWIITYGELGQANAEVIKMENHYKLEFNVGVIPEIYYSLYFK